MRAELGVLSAVADVAPHVGVGDRMDRSDVRGRLAAVLLENNEGRLTTRRYLPLEAMAKIGQPHIIEPAALTVATA